MFGYACRETPELMPAPIYYAHHILKRLAQARRSRARARVLGPDAKSQVTVRYENGKPVGVTQIVRLHPASRREPDLARRARASSSPMSARRCPTAGSTSRHGLARQPDRQVRHRRPGRRLRPHRPQDHRRHLRRRGPARRRRLLRQGPDQGRPLGRLCRALPRQERRGGRPCRALHDPALLRHRRGPAAVDLRRPARHRQGRRGASSRRALARGRWT